jgi:hypothetical protein
MYLELEMNGQNNGLNCRMYSNHCLCNCLGPTVQEEMFLKLSKGRTIDSKEVSIMVQNYFHNTLQAPITRLIYLAVSPGRIVGACPFTSTLRV